jgi:3-oxoadipate enol-lactonase
MMTERSTEDSSQFRVDKFRVDSSELTVQQSRRMRIRVGDIALNYEEAGSGTPLVLTHGLGSDLHYWDDVVEALARHHRVVRWDVRGFGESDKPPGPYSPDGFAGDLIGLLDALGIARAHLAGLSMGGVISQRAALDAPQRARSLILSSTSSEVGAEAAAHWQRLADRIEQRGFDAGSADASRSVSATFAAAHPGAVVRLTEQTRRNDPRAYAAAARAMSAYQWTAQLARLTVPVLLLQGLADQLTPPGGSVKMSRALPHARLLMFPDTGHNLPVEQPFTFTVALLAFTAALDASREK